MAVEDDFFKANPAASWNDFLVSQPGIHRMLAKGWNPGDSMPVDDFRAWQNNAALNPDGTIQGTNGKVNPATGMVDYELKDDAGFFGEFLNMAKIPLTFAGMAAGAGALNGMFSGLGSSTGWASMGGGGGFEGLGFLEGGAGGAGIGAGGGLGGGGMDFFNTDSLWGNSGSGGVDNLFGDWNLPGADFSTTGASGPFAGYDFGLGYPVGGEMVTNLAGGGLTQSLQSLFGGSQVPQSILKQALSKIFNNGETQGKGGYSFPFGDVLGGLLESYGAKKSQGDLRDLMSKSLEYIDPFHNQRPQYQSQFRNLTQDPSNFFRDPAISSMVDLADDTTSRKLASQGYNMSGNFATEVAKSRANEMFKNYIPYTDMIGTAAGYKLSPGNIGAATSIGQAAVGQGQQAMGGLGSAFNSAYSGNQPSYLDQMFGTQKNQNLAQLFMSGLS